LSLHQQHVAEPFGRQERRGWTFALEQIRGDRRRVHDLAERSPRRPADLQELDDALDHTPRGIDRRGEHLVAPQLARRALKEHEVREGAANVDAEPLHGPRVAEDDANCYIYQISNGTLIQAQLLPWTLPRGRSQHRAAALHGGQRRRERAVDRCGRG